MLNASITLRERSRYKKRICTSDPENVLDLRYHRVMQQCTTVDCEEARRRVMRFGRMSMAYSILNPGMLHWFDEPSGGVVGFVRRGGWWVIAGDPVCDVPDLPGLIERLEAAAAAEGRRVVYVVCTETMRLAAGRSHSATIMGAEPVWRPDGWAARIKRLSSLRAQLNRARNKGVSIEPLPIAEVPRVRRQLGEVIDDWLAHRPLPPLRFLVEPMAIDGVLTDRQLWVACRGGKPVAFLLASPVAQRRGYLVEQICRRHDAPNGTSELLIDAAMRAWSADGCDYATLGLVTLTPLARQLPQPLWLRAAFGFARLHGRRFYNFDGLEHFRLKMQPDGWEPISIITPGNRPSLAGFYAAGAAFCGGRSPASVLAEGALKALAAEMATAERWLESRRKKQG